MTKPLTLDHYLQQLHASVAEVSTGLAECLLRLGRERLLLKPHGDLSRWQAALNALPAVAADLQVKRDLVAVSSEQAPDQAALLESLRGLRPWRKGPFDFFGVTVDCEWRSDWKWQRLQPHISPLAGRRVLDVGCGSGYHLWRIWGEGAKWALGIDPGILFLQQFLALKRYRPDCPVWLAPARMEELPERLACFDTVFSMGVLYHRKSPLTHLEELRDSLRAGGELVLETLVVEGDEQAMLMPQDRYAAMRNVWFLPSVPLLKRWLERLGFTRVRCVGVTQTSTQEQRATEWMPFQSLADFLDPDNNELTKEGYAAPRRALLLAEKPS